MSIETICMETLLIASGTLVALTAVILAMMPHRHAEQSFES